jgi:SAM-dependent methyltransferase
LNWAEEDSVKNPGVFDNDFARGFTEARQAFIDGLLGALRPKAKLESALDVGCGVGYFSKFLLDRGFRVIAVDGREENAMEGRRRYPEITFLVKNVEDPDLARIGIFDFVLCVGLLYHLENPFRAIRNLHSLTSRLLLIESMCAHGDDPSLKLVDESRDENQGLSHVAFYPTEACLIKMLYRAGFPFVYAFEALPRHPLFDASLWKRRERTMLLASRDQLTVAGLKLAKNIRGSWEILASPGERFRARLDRLADSVRFRSPHASGPPGTEKV